MESDAAAINTTPKSAEEREGAQSFINWCARHGGGELQFSSVDTREVPRLQSGSARHYAMCGA